MWTLLPVEHTVEDPEDQEGPGDEYDDTDGEGVCVTPARILGWLDDVKPEEDVDFDDMPESPLARKTCISARH